MKRLYRWVWSQSITEKLETARWLIPVFLFLLAISFEIFEHVVDNNGGMNFYFNSEIAIFGVTGPILVWWVLGWVEKKNAKLIAANTKIKAMNEELEQRVAERTAELAQKNEALEHANAELKALDTMKTEFVSLVSHELRAPLTNINGSIELIAAERQALSSRRQEALDILRNESARLTHLVQNILDVSLLEAGRLVLNPGMLPLRPFLRQQLNGRLAEDKPHHIVLDLPPNLPPAWADEMHLADVVVNLVDNAVKYSPDGGEIRISARNGGDTLTLSVSDQGIGVPPAEQAHLFDRFYRANNGTDREVYGHGLGLYFCKKLVEAQQGRIWVESAGIPGQGTTFFVTIPACCEEMDDEPDFID
ncbi:MAG: sensor histidine kinase [Chloroflexi bacterium]|nr:MAG: sensor histidine kinase [Chloroflexota bacterium]